MQADITSQHLRGATELTHLSTIRKNLVPISDTLTYASRLKLLLGALMDLRRAGVERYAETPYLGPVDMLHMIHNVHWAVLNGDTQLLLCVDFDGPWEPYVRRITDLAPSLLDLIWIHCEGYEDHLGRNGYEGFAAWARKHQVETNFYFVADAEVTVDDLKYLKEFRALYERDLVAKTKAQAEGKAAGSGCPFHAAATRLHLPPAVPETPPPATSADGLRALKIVSLLDKLRPFFPDVPVPVGNGTHACPKERELFDAVLRDLIGPNFQLEELRLTLRGARANLTDHSARPPDSLPIPDISAQVDKIQGNILTGYQGMNRGAILLFRVDKPEAGVAFLEQLAPHVTSEKQGACAEMAVNVGLTYRGLSSLGIAPAIRADLPKEFREGMSSRAGMLGDIGQNHPGNWTPPVDLETVDIAVMLQTRDANCAEDAYDWPKDHVLNQTIQRCLVPGITLMHTEPLRRRFTPDGWIREHFGYREGLSQPVPVAKGIATPAALPRDRLALGDLLLGYPNERQEINQRAFLKDGSFMALRKLEQDVGELRRFVKQHDAPGTDPNGPNSLAAQMMGRTYDGAPLARGASSADPTLNEFDYKKDIDGVGCPLQSHIRRANPRLVEKDLNKRPLSSPRIMRRGFSYGPAYSEQTRDQKRGLMFMAFAASLADQYEVIQRWLNGGNSTGILSSHRDPIVGTVEQDTVPLTLMRNEQPVSFDTPLFVKLRWGSYFFFPSIRVLEQLTEFCAPADQTAELKHGKQLLERLLQLDAQARNADEVRAAALEWKKIIEDREAQKTHGRALWAAIRQRGGAVVTSYGVLVGSHAGALEVLGNESKFSVRRYWDRMDATLGGHYLGLDRVPSWKGQPKDYTEESNIPSQFILNKSRRQGFELARATGTQVLKTLLARGTEPSASGAPSTAVVDLIEFATGIVGGISRAWFGLPDETHMKIGSDDGARSPNGPISYFPGDFRNASLYLFFPNPEAWTEKTAIAAGQAIRAATTQVIKERLALVAEGKDFGSDLVGELLRLEPRGQLSEDRMSYLARNVAGTVSGFVVASIGSIATVLGIWLTSKSYWRLQRLLFEGGPLHDLELRQRLATATVTDADLEDKNWLMQALVQSMKYQPVPGLLHRETVAEVDMAAVCPGLSSERPLEVGERVVVSLGSAAADHPSPSPDILFGGDWKGHVHACPGKEMALGVLLGAVTLILELQDVERVTSTTIRTKAPSPRVP